MRRYPGDRYDDFDDEFDRPVRKKAGDFTLLWVLLGGGALLLLTCVMWGGVIGVITQGGGSQPPLSDGTQPAKFVGAWKGRWKVGGKTFDSVYFFNKDGSFREQVFDLRGRPLRTNDGQWQFRNRQIEIDWDNGEFEHATVTHANDGTMHYRIVNHTDRQQVGLTSTLRRQ